MRYWVFTSKPGHFDMTRALVPGETLDWPTFSRFKFEVGDLVFIYASNPVSQLIGKLEIEHNHLDFSEVDPRNDLRKWPRRHSVIPWLRLRVLQVAPVPFRPLQRGSLYYHTEFKPSPYPKLLHEGEIEYVLRAFDLAMDYSADMNRNENGPDPQVLARIVNSTMLFDILPGLNGAEISDINFSGASHTLTAILTLPLSESERHISLSFNGIIRINWDYARAEHTVTGLRLTMEDTYLLAHLDGADLEILADTLEVTTPDAD